MEQKAFQYRKRYEITCDVYVPNYKEEKQMCFNTASGMRSHVTTVVNTKSRSTTMFQYRKRYEITCDFPLFIM